MFHYYYVSASNSPCSPLIDLIVRLIRVDCRMRALMVRTVHLLLHVLGISACSSLQLTNNCFKILINRTCECLVFWLLYNRGHRNS